MFTGIVSALGRVVEAGHSGLTVEHRATVRKLKVGDSIAVNGACLTVVARTVDSFHVEMVPETIRRTNLGRLKAGDSVNLELPVGAQALLDGHLVQGHVDATAEVQKVKRARLGSEVSIELPKEVAHYVAEKGSIAIDGTSLTVARLDDREKSFTVALIPHTLENTVAGRYRPGTLVNLEVDVLARYLERLVRARTKRTRAGIK